MVKAPEKRGGGKPALGVRQKNDLCTKKYARGSPPGPDTNGDYTLRSGKFDSKDFCCIVDVGVQKGDAYSEDKS